MMTGLGKSWEGTPGICDDWETSVCPLLSFAVSDWLSYLPSTTPELGIMVLLFYLSKTIQTIIVLLILTNQDVRTSPTDEATTKLQNNKQTIIHSPSDTSFHSSPVTFFPLICWPPSGHLIAILVSESAPIIEDL
jgi:hypothetical protein